MTNKKESNYWAKMQEKSEIWREKVSILVFSCSWDICQHRRERKETISMLIVSPATEIKNVESSGYGAKGGKISQKEPALNGRQPGG